MVMLHIDRWGKNGYALDMITDHVFHGGHCYVYVYHRFIQY